MPKTTSPSDDTGHHTPPETEIQFSFSLGWLICGMKRILFCLFTTRATIGARGTTHAFVHPRYICAKSQRRRSQKRLFASSPITEHRSGGGISTHEDSLSDHLRHAYQDGQTDGVVKLISSLMQEDQQPRKVTSESLLEACRQATTQGRKGETISMINACIAACVLQEDVTAGASLAKDLFKAVETDLDSVHPDVLTFSLAYSAVARYDPQLADEFILDKAIRYSKKLAGSSRRKALAATRRKAVRQALDCENELQNLLGTNDLVVLSETDELVVINKPAGTVCHHAHTTTAGKIGKRNADVSLVDALLHLNVPLSTLNARALGLVHRLDRGTSGTIVLAKTDRMHAWLVTEFFLRRVQKTYRTIASPVPSQTHGSLNLTVDGRPAKSDFTVNKTRGDDLAMVEFKTFTGRKHQGKLNALDIMGLCNFIATTSATAFRLFFSQFESTPLLVCKHQFSWTTFMGQT